MSLPSGARRPSKVMRLWSLPAFGESSSGEFPATDPVVRTPLAAIDLGNASCAAGPGWDSKALSAIAQSDLADTSRSGGSGRPDRSFPRTDLAAQGHGQLRRAAGNCVEPLHSPASDYRRSRCRGSTRNWQDPG